MPHEIFSYMCELQHLFVALKVVLYSRRFLIQEPGSKHHYKEIIMKKQISKTVVAVLAAGFMATAMASENQFSKLDADADGYISAEEAAAHEGLQEGWQATDANMDGKVDAAEFSAFEMSGAEEMAPEGK